ncbi:SIR2 family protein [Aliarcobacter butzleri]|uniref:SIR2 family protein n=1 Tax=Aliarcobacter butzleri TaxID=28197 RepID=UPI00263D2F30|nr:SIR2 family protein [Aliarcobacter butzleri]MDN5100543.1 SIR2 family protein [Aliarcobacter butzleri]
MGNKIKAKEISQESLFRLLKDSTQKNSSIHFGFILGAGASVKSGIKSGSELAQKWYEEIKEDLNENDFEKWNKDKKINEKNLAESYTKIFAKRFEIDFRAGYEELQRYMDKAEPSIGYSFLAQLLSKTSHKFIITTNFDTMVEDALFGLKEAKPLVLGHELLSKYINPTSPTRPTVIKIHRDFLLDPYNTDDDIRELNEQWKESLEPLLKEHSMIVIGYGGNDDSLMNYLTDIKDRKPIYWCYRDDKSKLSSKIIDLLEEKDFVVQIQGFDKFMLLLNDKLNLGTIIDKEEINNSPIVKNALKYADKYKKQLEELTKGELNIEEQKAVEKLLPSWYHYQLEVEKETNDEKKEEIYLKGLEAYPNSHELMNNYANLLQKLTKNKESEIFYKKALKIKPNEPFYYGNYALLLQKINRNDEAEVYYKKALNIEPNHANSNGNYGQFLLIQGEREEAKIYIENAFKLYTIETDLLVELWFYRLAHYPEYFEEAKKELDLLLEKDIRSIGWDFSKNIEQAKKEGHKNIKLLEEYAKKITTP